MSIVNRRRCLQQGIAAGSALYLASSNARDSNVRASQARVSNAITAENQLAGTTEWQLTKTRIEPTSRYRCPWIEGYVSHASLEAGETLQFMISTTPESRFTIDVFRLGYYAGKGGCWKHSSGELSGKSQPVPEPGERRLIDCQWESLYELQIPAEWQSGVYVGKLTEMSEGLQSYVIFIVRDQRRADFLFQCSDHTWQAYNRWPSQYSLYDDGVDEWHWGGKSEVSFNRPYGKYCQIMDAPLSLGSGEFFLWEFPFAYWLEQHGYDVSYLSNNDLHRDRGVLARAKGFLSVGHDEYWTMDMYQHAKVGIEAGTSVGFFSGNAVCGKIEWNPESRSFRRIGVFGPPGGTRDFDEMASLLHETPYANQLVGAHSTGPVTGGADWICTLPDHWIYDGTGMRAGDRIPGVIGWEWHGDPAPIPGLEIVARGETQSAPGQLNGGEYTATIYPGSNSNLVFNASTCWWADGLSEPPGYVRPSVYTSPQGPDRRLQRMTQNILERMTQPR